ncbi:MAG: hypothetical protein GF405_03865 [Candidatus Eisenbacteria bacterium]|nr:hypothetical protein [Candidatus Eisenbacteria bacterium]
MRSAILLTCAVIALGALTGPASADDHCTASGLRASGLCLDDDVTLREMASEVPNEWTSGRSAGAVEKKNPMIAVLLSLAVPGWGEIYAGHPERGRLFMAAEAGIWIGYASFRIQEDLRIDDYQDYAQSTLGVPDGAGDAYYADIGDYLQSEGQSSYNEDIRREARSLYPDDLEAQDAYLAANGYFGEEAWQWGSVDEIRHYRELRQAAGESDRRAFYMTGLAVLNRALSAIDSAWMARRFNLGEGGASARVSVSPTFSRGKVGGRATLEITF